MPHQFTPSPVEESRRIAPNWVYFIGPVCDSLPDFIKVGVSGDPSRRLSQLQTASVRELAVVGVLPGDFDLERRIHIRFSSLRVNGEWFRVTGDLATFMRSRLFSENGWPLYVELTTINPFTGQQERQWRHESLLHQDDYCCISWRHYNKFIEHELSQRLGPSDLADYHHQRAEHHQRMAAGYAERGHERYGLQLTMVLMPEVSPSIR